MSRERAIWAPRADRPTACQFWGPTRCPCPRHVRLRSWAIVLGAVLFLGLMQGLIGGPLR